MTDLPSDPLDDDFAQKLRRLNPATASTQESARNTLSVETLLYQAGYQAALAEFGDVDQHQILPGERSSGSHRFATWMPMIAAGLMTAVLTLPIAYRMGQGSADTTDDKIVERITERTGSTAAIADQPDAEEPSVRSTDPPPADGRQDIPETTVRPTPVLNLARILQPEWSLPEPSTETMTAFNAPSLDSIPRSGWLTKEDEAVFEQETMSAGDLGKFTIGFQVNQQ